jgi:cytoskeletal protein CcmA (bactofilin family)
MLKRERGNDWEQDTVQNRSYEVNQSEVETTLGSDTKFKGTLTFEKPLKIDGNFEGQLTTKGSLIVGKSGEVHADIQSGNVVIDGKVSGNIVAEGKLQMNPTASLIGDIKAARLAIAEGATFVGHCDVNPAGLTADKKPTPVIETTPKTERKPISEIDTSVVKSATK